MQSSPRFPFSDACCSEFNHLCTICLVYSQSKCKLPWEGFCCCCCSFKTSVCNGGTGEHFPESKREWGFQQLKEEGDARHLSQWLEAKSVLTQPFSRERLQSNCQRAALLDGMITSVRTKCVAHLEPSIEDNVCLVPIYPSGVTWIPPKLQH